MKACDRRNLSRTGQAVSLLGFGGTAIGNLFEARSEADADAALQAAWDAGVSYYDTAPLKATLEAFADFDRINDHRAMRVSVTSPNDAFSARMIRSAVPATVGRRRSFCWTLDVRRKRRSASGSGAGSDSTEPAKATSCSTTAVTPPREVGWRAAGSRQ